MDRIHQSNQGSIHLSTTLQGNLELRGMLFTLSLALPCASRQRHANKQEDEQSRRTFAHA